MYDAYSAAALPRNQRFDLFRDIVEQVFCPLNVCATGAGAGHFTGSLTVSALGTGARMALVATSPCIVRRRAEDIARISVPDYLVKFQLKGRSIWTQRKREVHLRPGDFVIASNGEPYSLELIDDYSMPVIALSGAMMRDLTSDPDQFLGVRMSGDDADCGLLTSFVAEVVARLSRLNGTMLARSEANILDLLRGILAARAKKRTMSAAELRSAIKAFIRSRITDHRLGPAMIAAEFGITTRYVHALFSEEPETIGEQIRALRLQSCREALEYSAASERSLTDFALSWGFYDLSHMSRCFRAGFNLTPTEVRERARAKPCAVAQPNPDACFEVKWRASE
jgi:AraC-like DNA-binding protein